MSQSRDQRSSPAESTAALQAEIDRLQAFTDPALLASVFPDSDLSGVLRSEPADFRVTELSDQVLSGAGEHAWLRIQKTGQNTAWVAKQLAAFAEVESTAVGYAGLKDRHAVTEQWFSIWLPGKPDPDWSALTIDGVEVLEAGRHSGKLRRGDLKGNHFQLRIRELTGSHKLLAERLQQIAAEGVPNYFGSQRFGQDGGNLQLFEALGRRARLSRNKKSFALSAARSGLFNAYLSQRVSDAIWNNCRDDDVVLSDRDGDLNNWVALQSSGAIVSRPTGALWGTGGGRLAADEAAFYEAYPEMTALLERLQVKQHRRSLWLPVASVESSIESDSLYLNFSLPPGAFATTVVAALLK